MALHQHRLHTCVMCCPESLQKPASFTLKKLTVAGFLVCLASRPTSTAGSTQLQLQWCSISYSIPPFARFSYHLLLRPFCATQLQVTKPSLSMPAEQHVHVLMCSMPALLTGTASAVSHSLNLAGRSFGMLPLA